MLPARMNGIERTYDLLATTSNRAAVRVLAPALGSQDGSIRGRAIEALLRRGVVASGRVLIEAWDKLDPDDRLRMIRSSAALEPALRAVLGGNDERLIQSAVDMVSTLEIVRLFPELVRFAETAGERVTQRLAVRGVLHFVENLGTINSGGPQMRLSRTLMLRELAGSLNRYRVHYQDELVDAYLAACTWEDRDFIQVFQRHDETRALLVRRMRDSKHPGVIDLLARALNRPRLAPDLQRLLAERIDDSLGFRIIDIVGINPKRNVIRNLVSFGFPAACRFPAPVLDTLTREQRLAHAMALGFSEPDPFRRVRIAVSAVAAVSNIDLTGVRTLLQKTEPLASGRLLAAALHLARRSRFARAAEGSDDNPLASPSDQAGRDAELLDRIAGLIQSGPKTLQGALLHLVKPLTVATIMPELERLEPASQKRLCQVVRTVDPDALETIRDRLRHPVMTRRVQATHAAVAMGAIDVLREELIRLALHDHREGRIAAIGALGHGKHRAIEQALRDLVAGPEGPIRDAAWGALLEVTQ